MRFTARGVRETERPVSFIPKGALTHHLQSKRWYACGIVRSPRGCGFCGSLMDNATSLDRCCHCPRSRQNCFAICKTRLSQNALSSANCLRKPATGSFIADMDGSTPSIFFLRKRNKTQERKDGENEWRSTTWKQRLSAEETDAPLLRHPLI